MIDWLLIVSKACPLVPAPRSWPSTSQAPTLIRPWRALGLYHISLSGHLVYSESRSSPNSQHALLLNLLWWEIQSVWHSFLNRNLLGGPHVPHYLLVLWHPSQWQVLREGVFQPAHPVAIYPSWLPITVPLHQPQMPGQSPCFHRSGKEVGWPLSVVLVVIGKCLETPLQVFSGIRGPGIDASARSVPLWISRGKIYRTAFKLTRIATFETRPLCQQRGHICFGKHVQLEHFFFLNNNRSGCFPPSWWNLNQAQGSHVSLVIQEKHHAIVTRENSQQISQQTLLVQVRFAQSL